MKREILFKAKGLFDGKWSIGYYVSHLPYTPSPACSEEEKRKIENDIEHYIVQEGFSDWNMPRDLKYIRVDPETVCQFIGSKDKNKSLIFEGDKVKVVDFGCRWIDSSRFESSKVGEVVWSNSPRCFCVKMDIILDGQFTGDRESPILDEMVLEVVGNIYN